MQNNYLYNGKELLDEDADLGWLDYGFRNYDPQIGRFPQLDPLSWEYPYYTPYQFAGNDPIANVDLDGLEPWNVVSKIKSVLKEGGEHVVSGVRKSGLNIGKWTVSWFKDGVAFSHVFHSTGFLTQRFASATIHLLSSASNIATSVPFKMRGDLANSFKIPNQQQQAINAYNAASSLLNEAIDKGWRRAETVNPDDPVLSGWQSWEVNDITGDRRISGLVQAITPVYPEAAAIPFPKLGKLFSWLRSIKFGVGAAKGGTSLLKPLGLGSTGRTTAANLMEQMVMKDAMANPQLGKVVMTGMKDSRWLGWSKMQYSVESANGVKATVHYVGKWEYGVLKAVDDFKFK